MRIFLILAGLALSLAAQPQEIYRWVDKDGQVHYADQPGAPNAERVIMADPNSYASEPAFGDYAPRDSGRQETEGQRDLYATVTESPANDVGLGWRLLAGQQQDRERAEAGVTYLGRYGQASGRGQRRA